MSSLYLAPESRLSNRLNGATAPAEVQSVVNRLNSLLETLEKTFHCERAFSANVSHEVRTPVAGLRSTIEVALSRPRQVEEYARALGEYFAICAVVNNLRHGDAHSF